MGIQDISYYLGFHLDNYSDKIDYPGYIILSRARARPQGGVRGTRAGPRPGSPPWARARALDNMIYPG